MSGIAAIIRFDGGDVETGLVEKITEAISYRGPDGIQHRVAGPAAFGHCMLHTTRESLEEDQPLCNEDRSLTLVLDGWLSNWEELRADLLSRGARLRSRSDAELVLRAYEIWGEASPIHLEGEFAFLIWDERRQRAFCVRDHAGLRPLHYHWDERRLVVASDVAGILAVPGIERHPNFGMIAEFMASSFVSRTETIWKGIERPRSAHWMTFGREGIQGERYWSPPTEVSIKYRTDEEYIDHYRELFADCVRRSSRTHLPLGCEVSGGLDSSAVFAMAYRLLQQGEIAAPSINGYTLSFAETGSDADEIEYARAVAKHVGAEVREVPRFFPPLSWFEERGRADSDIAPYPNGAMPINLGEAAVSDGCRVMLNGCGGDEWLEGTPLYYAEAIRERDLSGFIKLFRGDVASVGLAQSAWWLFKFGLAQFLPEAVLELRRRMLERWGPPNEGAYWLSPRLQELLAEREAASESALSFGAGFMGRRGVSRWYDDCFGGVARDQGARTCARMGYDRRTPMYARRFIEFAFATPERVRSRGGTSKLLHRRAMDGLLPKVVTSRTDKAEFSIAFTSQLNQMRDLFCYDLPVRGSGCLDKRGIERLFHCSQDPDRVDNPVWKLWGVFGCENALEGRDGYERNF